MQIVGDPQSAFSFVRREDQLPVCSSWKLSRSVHYRSFRHGAGSSCIRCVSLAAIVAGTWRSPSTVRVSALSPTTGFRLRPGWTFAGLPLISPVFDPPAVWSEAWARFRPWGDIRTLAFRKVKFSCVGDLLFPIGLGARPHMVGVAAEPAREPAGR